MGKYTLRKVLESAGIESGDDRSFMVRQGSTDMMVSRRYLEGGWKETLDSVVLYTTEGYNIYGELTVVFVLENN